MYGTFNRVYRVNFKTIRMIVQIFVAFSGKLNFVNIAFKARLRLWHFSLHTSHTWCMVHFCPIINCFKNRSKKKMKRNKVVSLIWYYGSIRNMFPEKSRRFSTSKISNRYGSHRQYTKVQLFWEGHKMCEIVLMVSTFTK